MSESSETPLVSQTLTKSRFVMGLACPQKLVYARDKSYRNLKNEDSFLAALAEGGFQVGEFAKAHFPDGHDITTVDPENALRQTLELLQEDVVTIFEAAIQYENCFIRVDVLEKQGDRLRIHEVKAKSYDTEDPESFLTRKGWPSAKWAPYLYDVAFQKWVVTKAFPESNVTVKLMLVDKSVACPVDGLHQCFESVRYGTRREARQAAPIPAVVLDAGLLKSIPVDRECDEIYSMAQHGNRFVGTFSDLVRHLSEICEQETDPGIRVRGDCGNCEFNRMGDDDPKRSGFEHCLSVACGIRNPEPGALIFDLWNYRGKNRCLEVGVVKLSQLETSDIGEVGEAAEGAGVTPKQRQWLQVQKHQNSDTTTWFERNAWQDQMASWRYPLHFIDFETTRVAIPFYKGQTPYQTVAFQFSHHTVDEDGRVAHANQFLLANRDTHPNLAFVRALRDAIGQDDGTIFMYSNHENTTLREILYDILDQPPPDVDELTEFLRSIVTPGSNSTDPLLPVRPMVDQLELVKRFLYLPATHGSNSLKAVLPAMLDASEYLQERYGQPIYGIGQEVTSLNYEQKAWILRDGDGNLINPYTTLTNLWDGLNEEELAELRGLETIQEGGAALTAYARLMFDTLTPDQRTVIEKGLRQYCELDTLAMVLLHQGVMDIVTKQRDCDDQLAR